MNIAIFTASIRSNNSCETLERSNSVFSFIGLKIFQLQPLQITHLNDLQEHGAIHESLAKHKTMSTILTNALFAFEIQIQLTPQTYIDD